ncbi:hypothetical protein ACLOJK_007015 [Asimina triloba]
MEINFLIIAAAIAASLVSQPHFSVAGKVNTLESVPDLEKAMYLTIDGYPCVRLLNLSGEIGCANPGRGKVVAPIVRLKNADSNLSRPSAVLLALDEINGFLDRHGNPLDLLIHRFSPDKKFPQAEFAPYQRPNYQWNPAGSGIMWDRYNFPIASKNGKRQEAYPVDVAEFDLVMQVYEIRHKVFLRCAFPLIELLDLCGSFHDSSNKGATWAGRFDQSNYELESCSTITHVWSSVPPINVSSLKPPKPILLVVASMDSASFFRDRSFGADSPLSGMISLLAAVDALSHLDDVNELKKQLVFVVFTGESWGYLGSRRFLAELEIGSDAVNGLNSTLIELVLEIGSVGKGSSQGSTNFFAHVEQESPGVKEMFSAFEVASGSLGLDSVKIKRANISNPGIPPSSLMAFLRKNSSTSGVVLEEFDSTFTNNFYHSHLDDSTNVNATSIVAAASLVARTLYILATSASESESVMSVLNNIRVNVSLVNELLGCLLSCEPGLSCGLVKDFIAPSSVCPNHYAGVLLGSPSASLRPAYADDTSRYVPAYSTRLKFEGESWHLLPAIDSDAMGIVDPVWTESFWNTLSLRVYTVQSSAYDRFILVLGIGITIAAYAAIIAPACPTGSNWTELVTLGGTGVALQLFCPSVMYNCPPKGSSPISASIAQPVLFGGGPFSVAVVARGVAVEFHLQ